MKGLYGSKIGTIFRLLILVLFLILCFFIKRNVELMLPEAVEYAVLDNSNAISFSEADEAACADGDLTVNVLSRTTGAASTSNNMGLSEKVNIVYTDDKFPTVHNIKILKGSFFSIDSPLNISDKIVISDNLANLLFKSYDVIGNEIIISGHKKIISGIYIAENKIFSELSSNGQETVFVPFYGQSDSAGLSGVERIYFKGINGEISNRDIREFDVLIGEKLKYYQKTDLYASKILLKQMIDIMFLIAGAIVIFKLILIFIRSFEGVFYGAKNKNFSLKSINLKYNILICLACIFFIIIIFACCIFKPYIPDGFLPEHDRILDIKYYFDYIISSIQSVKLLERWSYYQTLIIVFYLFMTISVSITIILFVKFIKALDRRLKHAIKNLL